MPQVTAQLSNYRQSPRKVRLVANAIRGKNVPDALTQLEFMYKRASSPIAKLVRSAVANAKQMNIGEENLKIQELRVDGGAILYRRRSASRGRAPSIRKRTSHIKLVLSTSDRVLSKVKAPKEAKAEKKTKKTTASKKESDK